MLVQLDRGRMCGYDMQLVEDDLVESKALFNSLATTPEVSLEV